MKWMHMISWILLIVGGLNWGLVGLGGFMGKDLNLVAMIFGSMPQIEWIVYILVGLAAVYEVVTHKKSCKHCDSVNAAPATM